MLLSADLVVALSSIAAISLGLFFVGLNAKGSWSNILLGVAVLVLAAYALWLGNNIELARLLSVADVIAWGDLQLPATALLAGIAWQRLPGPLWQKYLLVGALALIGAWRFVEPYVGSPPPIGPERWNHAICMQTTKSTCSAAAAATLLARVGIKTSEAEMAKLCLTREDGTSLLGLYRGLKIKTTGTNWRVVLLQGSALDLKHQPLPAIVTINDPNIPDALHSVVVFGFEDETHLSVGDPFTGGLQRWNLAALERADVGAGIALIKN